MIALLDDHAKFGAYAELPSVKLWFMDAGGAGEPVVLLHPNTGTSETWEPSTEANFLGELSNCRRLLSFLTQLF